METDYYETKYNRSSGVQRITFYCFVCIVILFCLAAILSCKTWKTGVNENTDTKDSVRVEYREKVVKVPVTVYVEVPVEQKEKMTSDSTSILETSFAVSQASIIWIDGVAFLRHSLENKPQKIEKTDTANLVEKEKIVWKTRRVTYNKTEIREKKLNGFQNFLMWTGGISLAIVVIFIGFIIIKRILQR